MLATFLKIKKNIKNRGISLIEAILYVTLLLLITAVIVEILVAMGGVYKNIKINRELESSGTIVMESILREVRNSSKVVTGGSVFGINPGILEVSGIDEYLNPYEVVFGVSSDNVFISRDGGPTLPLNSSSVAVNNLVFTYVSNTNSEGVRIELEMSGTSGSVSKSEKFYGFVVLRGGY